jgi:hypothetical protein
MTTPDAGTTHPGRRPGQRPAAGTWIGIPVFILLFSAVFAALFSPVVSWARGDGTRGTFVARFEDCHKGCAWIGDFVNPDRKIAAQDVRYVNTAGLPRMKAGTSIPAVDVSSVLFGNTAYPGRPALRDALWPSVLPAEVLALAIVLMFVRWVWVAPVRYWRWRAA